MQVATFGGGCFWGVEDFFRLQNGVIDAISGYEGGTTTDPTYQDICTGTTGHAEVVQVSYDADKISYQQLLTIFFSHHNPTQLNRLGHDVGTQYRSAVFFHNDDQQVMAQEFIAQLNSNDKFSGRKIVTEVTKASTFYKAEDYHQDYLAKNGLSSCHI